MSKSFRYNNKKIKSADGREFDYDYPVEENAELIEGKDFIVPEHDAYECGCEKAFMYCPFNPNATEVPDNEKIIKAIPITPTYTQREIKMQKEIADLKAVLKCFIDYNPERDSIFTLTVLKKNATQAIKLTLK